MNALARQIFERNRRKYMVSTDAIEKVLGDLHEAVSEQHGNKLYDGDDLFLLGVAFDIYSKTIDDLEEEAIKAATASGGHRFMTKFTQAENKELTEELERVRTDYAVAMMTAETLTYVTATLLDQFKKQEMDPATRRWISDLRDKYYPRIIPRARMDVPGVYDLVTDTHVLGTYNSEEEAKEALADLLNGPFIPF